MLNAVSGVVRVFARDRSSRLDRSASEPTDSANAPGQPAMGHQTVQPPAATATTAAWAAAPVADATSLRRRPTTARRVHRTAIGAARVCADILTATPRARERASRATRGATAIAARVASNPSRGATRRRIYRRNLVLRATADRALPIAIALIVVIAAGVSLAPASPVGANQGHSAAELAYADVRLTVGGGRGPALADFSEGGAVEVPTFDAAALDDGTFYKPVAVDTSVQSSEGMLRHYKVREGDTLTGIASRFGVSMMTIWWANKLTSKDSLKVGQNLIIPPVNGLVVTVKAGDTLESLAAANKIDAADIVEINQLTDTNLIVGQVLVLPGAKGAPLPTPKPTPKPTPRPVSGGGGGGNGYVPPSGGSWAWPVPGGYISQYFHYGHYGIDIADDYGSPIVAPKAGVVVFAGWKNNGGGYQVWISHGNNIYSMSAHMSSVSVSTGQTVSKGQRVGRVGSSGWATGPHDHFSVSIGFPWEAGSYFVNPLRYY
ncbi:MAG TPA: M23 family metallopeptidase [Candidatus Binatia bacterium]|nr:M23 family metallopeptidase [Candidatus Binatia bacterium]